MRRLVCKGTRSGKNAETERGAVLLEFALVLPVLLALMLGIITGGSALSQKISLNGASREAARFGATLPIDNNMSLWLADVGNAAIGAAAGELDLGVAGREVCVAFVSPGSDPSDQTTKYVLDVNDNWTTTVGQTCFDDGRPSSERRVQVRVQRTAVLQAGLAQRTVAMTSASSVRFERFDS